MITQDISIEIGKESICVNAVENYNSIKHVQDTIFLNSNFIVEKHTYKHYFLPLVGIRQI